MLNCPFSCVTSSEGEELESRGVGSVKGRVSFCFVDVAMADWRFSEDIYYDDATLAHQKQARRWDHKKKRRR